MRLRHAYVRQSKESGFTLMELMIAILIITIGLAALANLQGKLTGYSAIAKQRTLAMNLAEQQVETMHSFYTMAGTGANACTTLQAGFDDLATCSQEITRNVGNIPFRMSWTISGFSQNADGTTSPYTSGNGHIRPDLKLVTINVAWTTGEGVTHDIELVDIVDATPVFNTGRVLARVDSNTPPRTPFDPQDFPGVVAISLGNEKLKGSTTPEPKIVNRGTNVITSFDVVTFMRTGGVGYLQRREEFKVLNCICTMNTGTTNGREPSVWNGTEYSLGDVVSKRTGSVSANESGQPSACEMCCRDHHDATGASVKYDPFRPAFSGETGDFNLLGDHAHYSIQNGAKTLAGEGDDYIEACRFIRKDGFFRLTTDISLENLDVVKSNYPVAYNSDYSTSVINFITDFSTQADVQEYPAIIPDGSYSSSAPGVFLNNSGAIQPTMARGIYVDYMPADLLKKIKCLKANGVGLFTDFCDTFKDPAWLEILPFYDIDVTSLANWNKGSAAIEVTNSPISDIGSLSFSRGEVTIAQEHWDVVTTVTAAIENSNSGLTDTNPVDPDDELESAEDIAVNVSIGGNPPANGRLVLGNIRAGSNRINVETVRVSQNPPELDCEIITVVEGRTSHKAYVCDLQAYAGVASGTVRITDYNALKVIGNTTTVLNRKVCTDSAPYTGIQVIDNGVVADPDMGVMGESTLLTFSGLDTDATVNITIEEEDTTCP